MHPFPFRASKALGVEEQLQLYARDLRHLLEIERGQRILLQEAYKETVAALASALGNQGHRDARPLPAGAALRRRPGASGLGADLADDPSAEYGFLLHDVGKIGIPTTCSGSRVRSTRKNGGSCRPTPSSASRCSAASPSCGDPGLEVVRAHHERWDGGYPDGLAGSDIPVGARIFAVADTLDAMTRPPLPAGGLLAGCGRRDPEAVQPSVRPIRREGFAACEQHLRAIRLEFAGRLEPSYTRDRSMTRKRDEPVRLTRIYTRAGDAGRRASETAAVSKTDPRIRAYGAVDEVNSLLGLALATPERPKSSARGCRQNDSFDLGADLSVRLDDERERLRVRQEQVDRPRGALRPRQRAPPSC